MRNADSIGVSAPTEGNVEAINGTKRVEIDEDLYAVRPVPVSTVDRGL